VHDTESFALSLARDVRLAVHPKMGTPEARELAGTAHGGDPEYAIDAVAEQLVGEAFDGHGDVAYFTEDAGLVVRGKPQTLFLIDPIDGTRPAAAGFETCCVSIAIAPYGKDVTLGDVTYGCLVELTTGQVYEARRGLGARSDREGKPSDAKELRGLFWAGGFRGQPAAILSLALQDVFDAPGSEGSYFDQGSAAYSLACVGTGRLDAFVDPGAAILEEVPGVRPIWEAVGGGKALNTVTYDVAAAALFATESGAVVDDARRTFDEIPLLDDEGKASEVATIAAGRPELHLELRKAVSRGADRVRSLIETVGTGLFAV